MNLLTANNLIIVLVRSQKVMIVIPVIFIELSMLQVEVNFLTQRILAVLVLGLFPLIKLLIIQKFTHQVLK